MMYIKIPKLIFTQNGDNLFSFSFQQYEFYKNCKKCCRKMIKNVKFPCCANLLGHKIKICNGIFKEDIVSFYFQNNPGFVLYEPIENIKIRIYKMGDKKTNPHKNYNFMELETKLLSGQVPNYHQANFYIGKNKQNVNLILDSGSSFIGIPTPFVETDNLPKYSPLTSATSKTTNLLLYEEYGTGNMGCSIINDFINIIDKTTEKTINGLFGGGVYYTNKQSPLYGGGIIGLGYTVSNYTNYGKKSYPPTKEMIENTDNFWQKLDGKIISPSFMDYIVNTYGRYFGKFVFQIKRSIYDGYNKNENIGKWILGGGEQYVDLYKGKLQNINLKPINNILRLYQIYVSKIQFKKGTQIFEVEYPLYNINNFSIIDSGTTTLVFPFSQKNKLDFYEYMLSLPIYTKSGQPFFEVYDVKDLNTNILCPSDSIIISQFPSVIYTIKDGEMEYKYEVNPEYYLQNNFDLEGVNVVYSILEFIDFFEENIMILGQPFLCSNYVVFDYWNKIVKIAPKK